ncbi:rho GTPase-activating protein 40 isoform X9 [Rhinolophus sinicus]|uniref:rho GTPase-activating protein 40 isoform X9 n=1 Tax=Rhinolophus sinicus TaxID=89399 RepID=UPI003D7A46B1
MAEPALLLAAQMERLAPVSLASPCPRIPRAHIVRQPGRCARRWTDPGCSSGPSSGPMSQLPQKDPPRAHPAECSHSRLSSVESLSMDGFWMEVEQIQQRDERKAEDGSGSEGRLPEEGEIESQWLQDTGLSGLLGGLGLDSHPRRLLSTLTQTQVAAVCRRLEIYNRSARRRHKAPVRDVRDIFGGFNSGEMSSENGDSGMKWTQLSSGTPKSPPAAAKPEGLQAQAGREEVFHMDSAYSEQAVLLLQRGGPPLRSTCTWSQGALPKFRIPKGRLGLTRTGDLSLEDMKKIHALALIEFTALCDVLGLELKRSKAGKRKATETRLFGVSLEALLEADRKTLPSTQVPLVLQALLSCLEQRGLDTEGILRVPGSQARVKGLEQKLERDFYTGLFSWEEVRHNDASDLLKRFIRELPTPLLTAEYLPAFAVVPNIPHLKQRLQALHLLILILPEPNRNALKVRKVNDSSSRRPQLCDGGLKTWLRRIHADRDKAGDRPEATPKVAKIQVAWPIKDPLEVPLTPSTKVAHVLRQFTECLSPGLQGQQGSEDKNSLLPRRSVNSANSVLYEIGGNISEHRLDPDTYLLDLYRANPLGQWVIKQPPT